MFFMQELQKDTSIIADSLYLTGILSLKGWETIYGTFSSFAVHFAIRLNGKHMVISSLSECMITGCLSLKLQQGRDYTEGQAQDIYVWTRAELKSIS